MFEVPSIANQVIILAYCLNNPNGLRVYEDGFVSCHMPTYNAFAGTNYDPDFFIPVYDFQSKNAGRMGQAGFSFLQFWGIEPGTDAKREVLRDQTRAQAGFASRKYVVIDNTLLPVDYRFNDCYFNFLTRQGDPCGFDPGVCCGGSTPVTSPMRLFRSLVLPMTHYSGNWFLDALPIEFPDGSSPVAGDTLYISFAQGLALPIVDATFPLGADIDFTVDAPTSESANAAFPSPDGRAVDFVDWNTGFAQYLLGTATYTQATGTISISEFSMIQWMFDFGINIGPAYLKDAFTYNMNKLLYIRATQASTGDTAEYGLQKERFEYFGGTGYTTSMGFVNKFQDVGMGYMIRPGSGLWVGNIFQNIDAMQGAVIGRIDAAAPIIPTGPVQNQNRIPYIFRGALDPNFSPIPCGLKDDMSRILFSCPAAWAGTQSANTVFYLMSPNGNTNNNVLSNFNIEHIIPDAVAPDPAVCVALWDDEPDLPGQTAIWAGDTAGAFYRMEWDGISTWVRQSPTDFLFGGTFSGVLYKLHFGVNGVTGNDFMIVMSHPSGSQFFNATYVAYWELTGANRNDPADWTVSIMSDTNSTFSTYADVWDTELPEVNGFPVFQGITYYKGDIVRFTWDGVSAWTTTIVDSELIQTQENVGTFVFRNLNEADGTLDSQCLIVAGRQGFNSQTHNIVQYSNPTDSSGKGIQTILHKGRDMVRAGNQWDIINLFY